MRDPRQGPELEDVTVAALIAQLFTIYLLVMHTVAVPSEQHWAHADPILTLLPRAPTLWIVPLMALTLAAAWWRIARPSRRALVQGAKGALLGAVLAATAVTVLRLGAGPTMPSFIPPEESAGPGFVLSMTAGFEEELVCRLGVMPLGYFVLRKRAPRAIAIAASVVLTGLVFSFWHALGEASPSATFFATRFIIPGCAMCLVWLVSPSAIVAGHCTAHLLIPALFVAPTS